MDEGFGDVAKLLNFGAKKEESKKPDDFDKLLMELKSGSGIKRIEPMKNYKEDSERD